MTGYAVVIEGSGDSFAAYVPELPGCITTGDSIDRVESMIRDAILVHVGTMRDHGEPVPEPTTAAVRLVPAE